MRFPKNIEYSLFKQSVVRIKDWDLYCIAIRMAEFRNICKILGK